MATIHPDVSRYAAWTETEERHPIWMPAFKPVPCAFSCISGLRKCCANDPRNEAEIDINLPKLWMWQLHCLILGHLGHSRTITLTQLTGHCEFNDNPIDRSFHRKLKCWLHWSTLQRSDLCGLTSSFLYQIIFCWLNLNVKLAKIWFFWWFNQVKPHYWMIESHVFTIKIHLWMVSCWLTVGYNRHPFCIWNTWIPFQAPRTAGVFDNGTWGLLDLDLEEPGLTW